jgi:hypothetical protein
MDREGFEMTELKMFKIAGIALFAWLAWMGAAFAQANGTGSTTHSAVTTAYTGNQLFVNNTAGNAVASPVTVNAVPPGQALMIHAMIFSTGTNKPGTSLLWLYSAPPTTTALVDYSSYNGPYLADFQANIVIGSLTCAGWQVTNDSSAKYFSECSGSSLMLNTALPEATQSPQDTIYVLEEVGAYTPISGEKHSYLISTLHEN